MAVSNGGETGVAHQPEPWQVVNLGQRDDFKVEHTESEISVTGICPRCRCTTTGIVPLAPAGGRTVKGPKVRKPPTVRVWCDCGFPHVGRPENLVELGCGAHWTVKV